MIENYVHWNEDIGEWQLVSSDYAHWFCSHEQEPELCSEYTFLSFVRNV